MAPQDGLKAAEEMGGISEVCGVPVPAHPLNMPLLDGAEPATMPGMIRTLTGYRRAQSPSKGLLGYADTWNILVIIGWIAWTIPVLLVPMLDDAISDDNVATGSIITYVIVGVIVPLCFCSCLVNQLRQSFHVSIDFNDQAQILAVDRDPACTCCGLCRGRPRNFVIPYSAIRGVASTSTMIKPKKHAPYMRHQVWLVCAPGTDLPISGIGAEMGEDDGVSPPGPDCLRIDAGAPDTECAMLWQRFLEQRPGLVVSSRIAYGQPDAPVDGVPAADNATQHLP
eukprot:TRINITY_DN13163_c0_g1_i1.p1 TRINITY_DN13163_c0_g1~~TRINITY_DN13163_c0_g1_i1.p1  ORF type:complete len:282 (+),score=23.77 TRINITY_DN13163_c0_g1_i1:141-986(+)